MTIAAVVLSMVCIYLVINKIAVNRELKRMAKEIEQISSDGSSCQLTVQLMNSGIVDLAVAVNNRQDQHQEEVAGYLKKEAEYKQSMADISHDLRTPLTALTGYLKLLRKEEGPTQNHKEYIAVAYDKAEALKRLVTSLFELARLECNAYRFDWSRVDLKATLEQQLASFYPEFLQRKQEPVVTIENTSMKIWADDTAVQRIFSNLLQNALNHGSGDIRMNASVNGGEVMVEVSNAAPKLKQEEVELLFTRAYMADPVRGHSGGGMGLAIVKAFAEQMKGSADARLRDGRLSVTVCFPLENASGG